MSAWFVIRAVLEGLAGKLGEPRLHPAAALGVIGFVLVLEVLHARAMREEVFRANAGIGTASVLGPLAALLVVLDVAFRSVLLPALALLLRVGPG